MDSLNRRNLGWRRAGPGRHNLGLSAAFIGFHLDTEMNTAVRARALASDISLSELLRTYIEWGLENDDLRNKA